MNSIIAAPITFGGFALAFAVMLYFLDKKLKVQEDPLVEKILGVLPGVNCGACGFASCHNLAEYCAQHKIADKACIPGGDSVNQAIAALVGGNAVKAHKRVPVCACTSNKSAQKKSFTYDGPQRCSYAHLAGGNIDCRYGCMGLGDCARVCPVNAISLSDGVVRIDYDRCIGCGKCVGACPRRLLSMVHKREPLSVVACSNTEDGAETKKVCSAGCIGCGICTKIEKDPPFHLKDRLSSVNYERLPGYPADALRRIAAKCPTKCIEEIDVRSGRRSSGAQG